MLKYEITQSHETTRFILTGDIDIDSTELMNEELEPRMIHDSPRVILDIQNVDFIDSTGVGLLLHLIESLKEQEKSISLINISPQIMEVFTVLQFPDIVGKEIFHE